MTQPDDSVDVNALLRGVELRCEQETAPPPVDTSELGSFRIQHASHSQQGSSPLSWLTDKDTNSKHNQDTVRSFPELYPEKNVALFVVADGHGTFGHDVSARTASVLAKQLVMAFANDGYFLHPNHPEDLVNEIIQVTEQTDKRLNGYQDSCEDSMSGSTLTYVLIDGANRRLVVANLGDSPAYMARFTFGGDDGNIVNISQAEKLTVDHKPTDEPELQRLIKEGLVVASEHGDWPNRVFVELDADGNESFKDESGTPLNEECVPVIHDHKKDFRVYKRSSNGDLLGGLNLSRAIGDQVLKPGLSASPFVDKKDLSFLKPGEYVVVIVTSDGVSDMMEQREIFTIFRKVNGDAKAAAVAIVQAARDRYVKKFVDPDDIDDISITAQVIIIELNSLPLRAEDGGLGNITSRSAFNAKQQQEEELPAASNRGKKTLTVDPSAPVFGNVKSPSPADSLSTDSSSGTPIQTLSKEQLIKRTRTATKKMKAEKQKNQKLLENNKSLTGSLATAVRATETSVETTATLAQETRDQNAEQRLQNQADRARIEEERQQNRRNEVPGDQSSQPSNIDLTNFFHSIAAAVSAQQVPGAPVAGESVAGGAGGAAHANTGAQPPVATANGANGGNLHPAPPVRHNYYDGANGGNPPRAPPVQHNYYHGANGENPPTVQHNYYHGANGGNNPPNHYQQQPPQAAVGANGLNQPPAPPAQHQQQAPPPQNQPAAANNALPLTELTPEGVRIALAAGQVIIVEFADDSSNDRDLVGLQTTITRMTEHRYVMVDPRPNRTKTILRGFKGNAIMLVTNN